MGDHILTSIRSSAYTYNNMAAKTAPGQLSEENNPAIQAEPLVARAVAAENPIRDVEIGSIPMMSYALSAMCLPLLPLAGCGFYTVDAKTEAAVMHMGVLTSMEDEAGLHCSVPCGMSVLKISTKQHTMEIPAAKIADLAGNPVMVSAILNYRVVDAKRALLNVEKHKEYVSTNAQAVMKQTISTFSYDELKEQHDSVNAQMRDSLSPLLVVAGIEVSSMCLNDLSYAPEVAAAMLKKQQARALVEARTLIVEGAVKIAQDAVSRLEADGTVQLGDPDKIKIVTNLLTVTCSDHETTPTVSLS